MMLELVLFIFMLAFQLTGAVVLLLNYCFKRGSLSTVIKNCYTGSNTVHGTEDGDKAIIPMDRLQRSAHTVYLNRCAFADLIIGYALASFGPSIEYGASLAFIGVFCVAAVLVLLEFFGAKLVAKRIYNKDRLIPFDSLDELDVNAFATHKEAIDAVDEIFKDSPLFGDCEEVEPEESDGNEETEKAENNEENEQCKGV